RGKNSEDSQLRKFETRFGLHRHKTTSEQSGSITPILRWLYTPIIEWPEHADHSLARLRRSSGGSITPIMKWPDYAGP
ncbi:hypothetical protein, partial [uncultured Caballeronia sp.]|uniref:hypothetical protein n=1 Tax=uncultured Caballeronia sp. TaxID=1827198 RepID=UPI0035C9C214